jgi:hypothetical protein
MRRYSEFKEEALDRTVEHLVWNWLWTCRKRDYRRHDDDDDDYYYYYGGGDGDVDRQLISNVPEESAAFSFTLRV